MKINCENAGKRFNRDWIFRNFTYEFSDSGKYAITGPNGSGKSTLLQVIAGAIVASEGKITFHLSDKEIAADNVYQYLSVAAPYLEVIEEMTILELLEFHQTFKPLLKPVKEVIEAVDLKSAANKQIRYYSSGMKQRVKLAQAIFSETDLVLLDEPTVNLDAKGISLYQNLVADFCSSRMVIVSSNEPQEYLFCDQVIRMEEWKFGS